MGDLECSVKPGTSWENIYILPGIRFRKRNGAGSIGVMLFYFSNEERTAEYL